MTLGLLLDLDGTLLDIDIDAFLERYFGALSVALAELVPEKAAHAHAMEAMMLATQAMMRPHPGRTNREVFYAEFLELTAIDLAREWHVFERFYEEAFPGLRHGIGPTRGARELVDVARTCGCRIVVATNPIFPLRAIEHRLEWAGLGLGEVDGVTSYETSYACKPQPQYFLEAAALAGLPAEKCLMVGDDPALDLPASQVGMQTFFVGPGNNSGADYEGTLEDLALLLPSLSGGETTRPCAV